MAGVGVLQRSHSWSIANCEEIMTLLCSSDYLCVYVYMLLLLPTSWSECVLSASSFALWNTAKAFQLKGGIERLSPGKSDNSSSGEVGTKPEECQVFPKKASAKYEKGVRCVKKKIQWETLSYISVCPLPLPGDWTAHKTGLWRGWSVCTYSTTNNEGHKAESFACSPQLWKCQFPCLPMLHPCSSWCAAHTHSEQVSWQGVRPKDRQAVALQPVRSCWSSKVWRWLQCQYCQDFDWFWT